MKALSGVVTMSRDHEKRRTVFIKRTFQMRFVAWIIGLLAVSALCSALVVYLLLSGELSAQMQLAQPGFAYACGRLWPALAFGSLAALVMAGLASTVAVVFLSHRIAGPLYRFERLCEAVGQGRFEVSAAVREADRLGGLADAFGRMLQALRARRRDQKSCLGILRETVNALRSACAGNGEQGKLIDTLDDQLGALARAIEGCDPQADRLAWIDRPEPLPNRNRH